jgi:hypothetical protein
LKALWLRGGWSSHLLGGYGTIVNTSRAAIVHTIGMKTGPFMLEYPDYRARYLGSLTVQLRPVTLRFTAPNRTQIKSAIVLNADV